MADKFTVINGNKGVKDVTKAIRTIAFHDCWERQYKNVVSQALEKNSGLKVADYPQEELMKIAFAGIKYINSIRKIKREYVTGYKESIKESEEKFNLISVILSICGCLKLKNFVITFPIKKTYDGEKWECKDYLYTMEVLQSMNWENPIGEDNISDFLWDYMNDDLRHAYIEYTNAMSSIYYSQTGRRMEEGFLKILNIPSYTVNKELGIIQNNKTGETHKMGKKPSNFTIVK